MLYCHAGCEIETILQKLKLDLSDIAPTRTPRTSRTAPRSKSDGRANQPTAVLPQPSLLSSHGGGKRLGTNRQEFAAALDDDRLHQLADELGVPAPGLQRLHVGSTTIAGDSVYTFPEFDGRGFMCGIATRSAAGNKNFLVGGKRGLTLPTEWCAGDGPVLIPEGPSDVAALIGMGLSAVGRPSAKGGADLLAELLRAVPASRGVVVLGEFDPKPDGTWPGRDGAHYVARKLANALRRSVTVALPPGSAKDVRDWLMSQRKTT